MARANKTNAMRILEKASIEYIDHYYGGDDFADGITVANLIQKPLEQVFKTLVTIGASRDIYVFVIPVASELSLKLAAKACGEKSIAMLPVKDITHVTGYIKGGCSPIGMKKNYPTVIDASAQTLDTMIFSGGKRGVQIELKPTDLANLTKASFQMVSQKS